MSIALALLATFAIPAAILLGFLLWDAFEKFVGNYRTAKAHRDASDDLPDGDCFPTLPECRFHSPENDR